MVTIELLAERFNFIVVIVLMMTGLYAVIATGNLVKRLVGLSLFQTSVFLLYITMGKVFGGQPPILPEDDGAHGSEPGSHAAGDVAHGAVQAGHGAEEAAHGAEDAAHGIESVLEQAADAATQPVMTTQDHAVLDGADALGEVIYSNPLPHVLILTAIVVGVATLAVGLALVVRIRESYGTIEDEAINRADYAMDTGEAGR